MVDKFIALRDKVYTLLSNDLQIQNITKKIIKTKPLELTEALSKTYIVVNPPYFNGNVSTQESLVLADTEMEIEVASWKYDNALKLVQRIPEVIKSNQKEFEKIGFSLLAEMGADFTRIDYEGNKVVHYANLLFAFRTSL